MLKRPILFNRTYRSQLVGTKTELSKATPETIQLFKFIPHTVAKSIYKTLIDKGSGSHCAANGYGYRDGFLKYSGGRSANVSHSEPAPRTHTFIFYCILTIASRAEIPDDFSPAGTVLPEECCAARPGTVLLSRFGIFPPLSRRRRIVTTLVPESDLSLPYIRITPIDNNRYYCRRFERTDGTTNQPLVPPPSPPRDMCSKCELA